MTSGSTADSAAIAYEQVMDQTGFYRRGQPGPGVLDAQSLRTKNQIEKMIRYGAVIDEKRLNARSVFELSGSPCIYFTQLSETKPKPSDLHRLQKLAWNHGSAPLLWVVTPVEVMLFNCYLKPSPDDAQNPARYLVRLFKHTEKGLRDLRAFAGRSEFESGNFWLKTAAKKISRKERVDAALLADLQEAEDQLVAADLKRNVAHSLLGRSIFVSYLQDRGILTKDFLQSRFGIAKLTEALSSKTITYELFRWVRQTFNGDLFPLTVTNGEITREEDWVNEDSHLRIVRDFLSGTDLATGQLRLWPYQFDVIPIELISSIYENFVHSNDPEAARERSTHYTPVNLVDLTLSQVFDGLPGDAKVADLSCGSGLFLVESLRRLVSRRVASGEELSRSLLRDTVYNQIYGVDVSPEAIEIAAFSLYLALLELDPNPEPPEDLSFRPLIGTNLFGANSFDTHAAFNFERPFLKKEFQAIVGNPPWKRSKRNKIALEYCQERGYPLALDTPDQAFLWRIGDFSNRDTKIGLVLHSKPFFSKTARALKAKSALLNRYKPVAIINLSNLRKDNLFPKSKAPAMILIAEACKANPNDSFNFVRVDWSESFQRHGIIELGPEGVRHTSTSRAAGDPDFLKVASFAGPRDMELIDRLRSESRFITLGTFSDRMGWFCGRGIGVGKGVVLDELTKKLPEKYLESGTMPAFFLDLADLANSKRPTQARRGYSQPELFAGPLLICTRGIKKSGFYSAVVEDDLLYSEQYIGFSAAQGKSDERHYLNAILNSSLSNYLLFLTSSVWGVERDKVEKIDLLQIPIPDPDKSNPELTRRVLAMEAKLRDDPLARNESVARNELNTAVFDLYSLTASERILVQDVVNLTIDLHLKRRNSAALRHPTIPELESYAKKLISVIQPFLMTLNETTIRAQVIDAGSAPLQVIKFGWEGASNSEEPVEVIVAKELKEVLDSIAKELPAKLADHVYARRVLRIYTDNGFYLIKPAQLRYWSQSAGLSDADIVISEHMTNKNGASQAA